MPELTFSIYPVEDDEPISRFLTDDKQFRRDKNRVHHSAFKLPRSKCNISTYRIKGLSEPDIWYIAKKFVTEKRPDCKEVLARADLPVFIYKENGLSLTPDTRKHIRHANIEGWPSDEDRLLEIKKVLANEARLTIKP